MSLPAKRHDAIPPGPTLDPYASAIMKHALSAGVWQRSKAVQTRARIRSRSAGSMSVSRKPVQSGDCRAHLREIGPAVVALREVLVRPARLGLGQLALEVVRYLLDELPGRRCRV